MAMSKRRAAMDALIEATIELLGERSPTDVPVKAIAAHAGVNHGLVHHYFGSKDELVRAAIRRGSARLYDGQPAELRAGYTFRFLRERPGLVRALARIVHALADELCEGRQVHILEGGYSLEGLEDGSRALLDVLVDPDAVPLPPTRDLEPGTRLADVPEQVGAVHGSRTPGFGAP